MKILLGFLLCLPMVAYAGDIPIADAMMNNDVILCTDSNDNHYFIDDNQLTITQNPPSLEFKDHKGNVHKMTPDKLDVCQDFGPHDHKQER